MQDFVWPPPPPPNELQDRVFWNLELLVCSKAWKKLSFVMLIVCTKSTRRSIDEWVPGTRRLT